VTSKQSMSFFKITQMQLITANDHTEWDKLQIALHKYMQN